MRRTIGLAALALALAGCVHVGAPEPAATAESLSRQILVTAHQPRAGAEGLIGDPTTVYLRRRGYGPAPNVDRLLDRIADDYNLTRLEGWQISSLDIYCEVYELGPGQDHAGMLSLIDADPRVESAQAMHVFETQGVVYDDPYASMQPALADLSLDSAHERATGRGVTVAVIDSLVDNRHPEIRGRVAVRRDLVSPRRRQGLRAEVHGTAMAGVIASAANNAEGIVGVAPDAEIVSLRACWTIDAATGSARCSSLSLAQALEAALGLEVDVINMSLSGPGDPLLGRLIDVAIDNGVIIVAALPDDADARAAFPASHPGVIAAGDGQIAARRPGNALNAPGNEVLSTTPGSSYAFFSGNSMSAAFIAGVAALLVERQPAIDSRGVLSLLAETSTVSSINACLAVARLASGADCPETAGASVLARGQASARTRR